MTKSTGFGPLDGVRVLDISNVIAGPTACQILGDYGAEVVKIEHPDGGDSMRQHGPAKNGFGLYWKTMGRNKRSVGLKLSDPVAAEIFLKLVETADVIVENFRPGTLERWGLGFDVLRARNPDIILVRISGYGQSGPYVGKPAFGTTAEAMSGFAYRTGPADAPPTLPPYGLADSIAGMAAAFGALAALRAREVNGAGGQVVDLSILEAMMSTMSFQVPQYDQLGIVEARRGNGSVNSAPRNTYLAKDGRWIALSASTTSIAIRLFTLMGHTDLIKEPWFADNGERAKRASMLDDLISTWAVQHTRDEILQLADEHAFVVAPVYSTDELVEDPQVRALDMVTTVNDPDLGDLLMQNVLFRMSKTPGEIKFAGAALGAATAEILIDELGLDPSMLAELRDNGSLA